jgi:hypothetical protein
MSTTSKVMYFMRGSFQGVKGNGQCYYSDRLDSLATKAIEGLRQFLELLLVITHFFKGRLKEYFCLAAIVDKDFDTSH